MELKILILSHGKFCEEIIRSAEMIVGKNPNLYSVPLLEEDDHETYSDKILKRIDSFKEEPFLIIVDIVGGTPFNCSMQLMKKYPICLITGLSLAMLLEAYFLKGEAVAEAAEKILASSQESSRIFDSHAF